MLSKVLPKSERGLAQPAIFPSIGEPPAGPVQTKIPSNADADLSARVQDLERRLQIERKEAFTAGLAEGEEKSRAELQPVLERLNRSVTETVTARSEMRRRAERDAVRLALLIARRVLHRELSVDEGALAAVARVAFDRLTRSESYRVVVHPRFAASVTGALPAGRSAQIRVDPDPGCDPGTLIIHTAEGTVDASIDAQLDEISRGLADRLV